MTLLDTDIDINCEYNTGGITKLWFANYSEDFDMKIIYDIDNPTRVSGFSESQIFFEIHVENTIDNFEQIHDPFNNVWNKKMTLTIPCHSGETADNVDKISKGRFVVVYKDVNGKYWLSGFDRGYIIRENIHRTETSAGRNAYGLIYEEQSRYQDRELTSSAISLVVTGEVNCEDYYSITMDSNVELSVIANCIVGDFD